MCCSVLEVSYILLGKMRVGGGRWLSGCLDGLDKDIKGKQKAELC